MTASRLTHVCHQGDIREVSRAVLHVVSSLLASLSHAEPDSGHYLVRH